MKTVYCVVIHKPTGCGFTMNRNYQVLTPRIENVVFEDRIVDTWDGWQASFQRPEWTKEFPDEEFLAVWYDDANGKAPALPLVEV
jgi:hypothetical protein